MTSWKWASFRSIVFKLFSKESQSSVDGEEKQEEDTPETPAST